MTTSLFNSDGYYLDMTDILPRDHVPQQKVSTQPTAIPGTRLIACPLENGVAAPCDHIGLGMLRGLADADGLAVVTGDVVAWLPLPWRR